MIDQMEEREHYETRRVGRGGRSRAKGEDRRIRKHKGRGAHLISPINTTTQEYCCCVRGPRGTSSLLLLHLSIISITSFPLILPLESSLSILNSSPFDLIHLFVQGRITPPREQYRLYPVIIPFKATPGTSSHPLNIYPLL